MLTADEGVPDREPDVKASSASTHGALALYRSVVDGLGPPCHVHVHEDEAIYVLAGSLEADCGDETFTAGPGSFVFMPRGLWHTFHSVDGPAEILFTAVPGRIDEYFVERDRLVAAGAEPEEIFRLARTFGF